MKIGEHENTVVYRTNDFCVLKRGENNYIVKGMVVIIGEYTLPTLVDAVKFCKRVQNDFDEMVMKLV